MILFNILRTENLTRVMSFVTQKNVKFWGSQQDQTAKRRCQNWCRNRLNWKRSQFTVNSITPAEGVAVFYSFYKTRCRVLVSIRIFEYFSGRISEYTFPPTNPSPSDYDGQLIASAAAEAVKESHMSSRRHLYAHHFIATTADTVWSR